MISPKVDAIRRDCRAVLQNQKDALSALRGDHLVITGGTGFTGSWLTELVACLNDDYSFGTQITLISRSTDHFRTLRPHLAQRKDVRLIKADTRHLIELPRETQWLIHAAGNPDNRFHSTRPIETMSSIADGTSTVLRAVDRCSDFKMMLNISSGLVYGSQPWTLTGIPENFQGGPPCSAVSSVYAEAKRYAETLCAAARTQARIPCLTARPFAFIGPYQSMETPWAINNFIRDALSGNPIRVLGDGQTVRSYMYASDMAFWYLKMLSSGSEGTTYNIGSSEEVTLENLARMISSNFQPQPEIRLRSSGGDTPRSRFIPDLSLAERTLGLKNTVSLSQAIKSTLAWNQQT